MLREALASVVGGGWQIEVGLDSGGGASAAVAEAARPDSGRATPSVADQPPPRDEAADVDEESDEVHGSRRAGGDAEAAAIELLQTSLGARPIDAPGR